MPRLWWRKPDSASRVSVNSSMTTLCSPPERSILMKRIVVVDDQPMLGTIYRTKFTAEGYQVDVAFDGQEALEVIPRLKPDLVLLDLMLPKIDGLEVLKRLRANSAFETLPIIVFSGTARLGIVEDAIEAGATMVLSKLNTSPKRVIEIVNKTLAQPAQAPGP